MKIIKFFKKKKEEGFTLLEVMVSLSILAVGILGVIGMYITSIGGNSQGRNTTEASVMAQSKMDYLQNAAMYEDLGSLGNGSQTSGKYTMFYNTTTVVGYEMKKIDIRVDWTIKGTPHSIKISSLRAKG